VFINGNNGMATTAMLSVKTGHSDFAVITNIPFIVKSADLYAIYTYNYSTQPTAFFSSITPSTYKLMLFR
jgi:hypothetical protein